MMALEAFTLGSQLFTLAGADPAREGMVHWATKCPDCSAPFLVMTKHVPDMQRIRRRCDDCKRPGKPVSIHGSRTEVAENRRNTSGEKTRRRSVSATLPPKGGIKVAENHPFPKPPVFSEAAESGGTGGNQNQGTDPMNQTPAALLSRAGEVRG